MASRSTRESHAEAESYRRAAYSLLNKEVPYIPPTEEELHDPMDDWPQGRSIRDIIGELEGRSPQCMLSSQSMSVLIRKFIRHFGM